MMSEPQRMQRLSQMNQNGGKQIKLDITPATNGIAPYINYICTHKVRGMDNSRITVAMTKVQVFLCRSRRIPGQLSEVVPLLNYFSIMQ
jgi:hypothetical protein